MRKETSQTKRVIQQVKTNAIRQVGNVLIKALTAFLSRLLGRNR